MSFLLSFLPVSILTNRILFVLCLQSSLISVKRILFYFFFLRLFSVFFNGVITYTYAKYSELPNFSRGSSMPQKFPFLRHSSFYAGLIDRYTRTRDLNSGAALHALLIVNGSATSARVSTRLIVLYTECKQLANARKLFDKIPKSDNRGWLALIGTFARNGYYQEVMSIFEEMQNAGFEHDRIVIPSVLKSCAYLSDWETGKKLHAVIVRHEFGYDAFVMCALVDMYSKCRMVEKAIRVFDLMGTKDVVALNAMVSGYVRNGFVQEAQSLVERMKLLGVTPDIVTWNSLISGFSQTSDQTMVGKIFQMMTSSGFKPDVVSWTSVISGLVQNFQFIKAYKTFQQMLQAGLTPTAPTISALLPVSASIADSKHGKEIHAYSLVMGFENDVYVRSALIDMYAKCGFITDAMSLFKDITTVKNTVTYNSMIFCYANHGYCQEAIQLFYQMLREERKLDHLTFSAALTACVHGGMIDLGESLFQMMQHKYGIVPRLEHYACMVDLLGKAGNISEAYGFIERMPIEPDLFIWGALLGACRQHGFVDLAERAAEELAKLEPQSSGSSVILSSLYANSSNWEEARKMKKLMKKRKLRKFHSRSWMETQDAYQLSP